jgi:hypothetical protein
MNHTADVIIDPNQDRPRKGDVVAYIAINEASFGGIVEDSHQDPDGQCRFRVIGHEGLFLHEAESWRSRRILRPLIEWKPGTPGTATVRGVEQIHGMWIEGARGSSYIAMFMSDAGVSSRPDYVTDFIPDDAKALRAEVAEYREGYEQQNEVIQKQHRTLLDIWHMCEPSDTKHRTFGQDPEQVFQTVKAEVERLRAARTLPTREELADAWEAGYEARDGWTPVGPTGIPYDPPLNPHDETRPTP